jgi:hypothetical protein
VAHVCVCAWCMCSDTARVTVIQRSGELFRQLTANAGISIKSRVNDTRSQRGVTVVRVVEGSSAFAVGLQPGHVVERVNGAETRTHAAFVRALDSSQPGDHVHLIVQVSDNVNYMSMPLRSKELDFDAVVELRRMASGALMPRDELLLNQLARRVQEYRATAGDESAELDAKEKQGSASPYHKASISSEVPTATGLAAFAPSPGRAASPARFPTTVITWQTFVLLIDHRAKMRDGLTKAASRRLEMATALRSAHRGL